MGLFTTALGAAIFGQRPGARRVIYPDQMTSVDRRFADFRDALVSNAAVSRISL